MNKLTEFVRLDFITIKPYFTVKNLLIYAVMALFLTTMSENPASGMGVGVMLGTMFMGYPFALSEKSNMDALYATLSVNRKTVVLGRYIFALLLNVCAILLSAGMGTVGQFALNAYRGTTGTGDAFAAFFVLFALFLLIQAIQLPIFFKIGYTKAKFLSIIPFIAIMVGYISVLKLPSDNGRLSGFLTSILESGFIIPIIAVTLLIVVFISYRLSLAFYRKREF
jgi:hypothetical protein